MFNVFVSIRSWRHRLLLAGLLAALLPAATGCSRFDLLNALAGVGAGAAVRTDVPYGDHPRQRLDVYRPRLSGDAPPVVIFFYGGSWQAGDKRDYRFVGRALASAGYVAVVPDYRVYPEVTFPAFVEDAAAAVAYVERHAAALNVDPARIHVLGHSAGAHVAAMVTMDENYLAAAGTSKNVIRSAAFLAGPYDFVPLDDPALRRVFEPDPDRPAVMPVTFVDGSEPPILLIVGLADDVVDPRNTFSLADRIKAAGGDVTVITYPRRGHVVPVLAFARGFRRLEPVLADVIRFFDKSEDD